MGFKLRISNSLDRLSLRLAEVIGQGGQDPFMPDWVVTQTEGMNIRLKQEIAERVGIASNIRFLSPDELVSQVLLWSEASERKPMDQETVRWVVYKLLASDGFHRAYPETAAYFEGNDIKRIALADELADLFDQYQVYRTDEIQKWATGIANGTDPEDWQEWIWRSLKAEIGKTHSDRAENADSLEEKLKDKSVQQKILSRMEGFHVFGVAILTPYYLRLFRALAGFMDVHLYLLNPAPEQYWLDNLSERSLSRLLNRPEREAHETQHLQVGNGLLMNWGRIVRDSFELLFTDEAMFNDNDTEVVKSADTPTSLLQKVQDDVLNNLVDRRTDDAGGETPESSLRHTLKETDTSDGSILINSCHTPLREVEVLYNHLTGLVDRAVDGISPRDILVLCSDIDRYAPYIDAVFGYAPYRFPYTVSDRSVTSDNNMFYALHQFLSLDEEDMAAENVMKFLESPYIRSRFRIKDADAIRDAVREAGIIEGLEGDKTSETRFMSWEYGLKRILLGLCITGEPRYDDGEDLLIPLDTAEGSGGFDRIRFIHFIHVLKDKLKARRERRTIGEWAAYIQELMEDMVFEAGDREDEDHPRFVNLVDELKRLDDSVGVEVDFAVFRHSFLHRLSAQRRSQAFLGTGITFCSLVPMRSIPFRVVAMLGMDFDKFPRKDTPHSFSKISRQPRLGDRNVRNNDRHLFLETLLSARDSLYISYVGVNEKNGSDSPVSSMVDELIDYVARGMGMDTEDLRESWVKKHPLHGFHSTHFKGGDFRNHLDPASYKSGIEVREGKPVAQTVDTNVVDLKDLLSFLDNPPRTYLQKQLGVYLRTDELLLPRHEKMELDTLESWQLKSDLVKVTEDGLEGFTADRKMQGDLPLANMGVFKARATFNELSVVREIFENARDGREETALPIKVELSEGGFLKGSIGNVYGNRLVFVSHSEDIFKYQVKALTQLLALKASGHEIDLVFIDGKKAVSRAVGGDSVDVQEARKFLSEFVGFYRQGVDDFFRYHPAFNGFQSEWKDWPFRFFMFHFEKSLGDSYSYGFKDEYLSKAADLGFVTEDTYGALKENWAKMADFVGRFMPMQAR